MSLSKKLSKRAEAAELAKWAAKAIQQLTPAERAPSLRCHDCGKPVRASKRLIGAPRCPACREDRASATQAIEMAYHPPVEGQGAELKPALVEYMSAEETLAHLMEYGQQLRAPVKVSNSLGAHRMLKISKGPGKPKTGARWPTYNKGYFNGEEPVPMGRPRTRPVVPKEPSLRERERLWAQRIKPDQVSDQDWELLRLATVVPLKAPAIAELLGGVLKPAAIRQRISRARVAGR